MKTRTIKYAFPCDEGSLAGYGMTLRDYFAAKAMQVIFAAEFTQYTQPQIANAAYQLADAMMEERK